MYSRSLSILHASLKKRHGLYIIKRERLKKERVRKDDEKEK
jgi:hypothetical protein